MSTGKANAQLQSYVSYRYVVPLRINYGIIIEPEVYFPISVPTMFRPQFPVANRTEPLRHYL